MTPIPIGPLDESSFAEMPGIFLDINIPSDVQQVYGPFLVGSALYAVLKTGTFSGHASDIYKSTDGGETWTACDFGNSGNHRGNYAVAYDGVSTIRMFWAGFTTFTFVAASYNDFDTTSDTWGTPIGGGPVSDMVFAAQFMADGSNLLFMGRESGIATTFYRYARLSAGTWGAAAALDANADSGLGTAAAPQALSTCTSPDGTVVHTCFAWLVAGDQYQCYQAVTQAGALGAFASILSDQGEGTFQLAVFGTNLVFTFIDPVTTAEGVIIGSPISAPVLSAGSLIDPGYPADLTLIAARVGAILTVGSTLYVAYILQSADLTANNRIRFLSTGNSADPTSGWTASTAFDGTTDGGSPWEQGFLACVSISSALTLTVNSLYKSPDLDTIISYALFVSTPTPTPQSVLITLYGWKLYPNQPCGDFTALPSPAKIVAPTAVLPILPNVPAITPRAPRWNNLCWALRNGAVDASQFAPGVLDILQRRCSELGYAGACVPPPDVQLWLDQNRRDGTLPPIFVSQGEIDSIPQAPNLTGVNCPTSWKLGGLVDDSTPVASPEIPSVKRVV